MDFILFVPNNIRKINKEGFRAQSELTRAVEEMIHFALAYILRRDFSSRVGG